MNYAENDGCVTLEMTWQEFEQLVGMVSYATMQAAKEGWGNVDEFWKFNIHLTCLMLESAQSPEPKPSPKPFIVR